MVIRSFRDSLTERIFLGVRHRSYATLSQNVIKAAQRKLDMLDAATEIRDLQSPPGNRLERLKGDLDQFWSIRVNDQWRIIFRWTNDGPDMVQIIDYH